ncbi:unnamed protein product [Rangifer tarandus platyrhynchus]|uniref:Uncharacterized protein n=2 Tax=Rangifer tarandus platyrhynchus TaxID=3082113 RepID=A0ABN8Y4Y7_RANTA|nr:unnamed protein product [Rangifer tarandus platyrhynchus]CAI9695965.1 unnamed protein product [Rangifer tarandus platyrhynchus]
MEEEGPPQALIKSRADWPVAPRAEESEPQTPGQWEGSPEPLECARWLLRAPARVPQRVPPRSGSPPDADGCHLAAAGSCLQQATAVGRAPECHSGRGQMRQREVKKADLADTSGLPAVTAGTSEAEGAGDNLPRSLIWAPPAPVPQKGQSPERLAEESGDCEPPEGLAVPEPGAPSLSSGLQTPAHESGGHGPDHSRGQRRAQVTLAPTIRPPSSERGQGPPFTA